MTDIDHIQRRLSDLESIVREQGYRIKALEKDMPVEYVRHMYPTSAAGKQVQFCPCGRDLCRKPECPSHKTDPLER